MNSNQLVDGLKQNWMQVGMIGVGGLLVGLGIVKAQQQTVGETVTVIHASPSPTAETKPVPNVVIDVQGAVVKPGIYHVPQGKRVGDVLIAAGGLAAKADRSYVARFINQAQMLSDGVKIYIPEVGEEIPGTGYEVRGTENMNGLVSINTASEAELETLWGIGAARAATIIENRPYGTIDELASKAKIPADVIEKNKTKLGL